MQTTETSNLKLHVCDANFAFSSATHILRTGQSGYNWATTSLDSSTVTTRRLYLSTVDTRAPVLTRRTVNGSTLTLTYDERLKMTSPTQDGATRRPLITVANREGQRFVVSEINAGDEQSVQDVTMTIMPPARHGEQIFVTYDAPSAIEGTQIQDPAGNDAVESARSNVENLTPDNPRLDTIAFADESEPYGAGEIIAIDAIFTESVTVTGQPTVAVEVGAESRKALWKTGQSPGTTHRFEYTVQTGEEDEFGPDILVNGLTAPTGSTITTTADGAAVLLGHRKVKGGAERYVDAVPPTLRPGSGDSAPAQVTGPTVTVAWNEPLDETSVPAASRFTVTVTPMGDPAQTREVTEVSVAGKVVTLTLERVAALSASSTVTLSYAVPTTNPLRDLVGNNAAALDAQSVTVLGATNNVATARFTFENSDASVNVGDSMRVLAADHRRGRVRHRRKVHVPTPARRRHHREGKSPPRRKASTSRRARRRRG